MFVASQRLAGVPDVVRFAPGGDGRRNIQVTWPSGARVMVSADNDDPEAVARDLSHLGRRCQVLGDDGVIRFAEDGSVWFLNRRDRGWGERGYRHQTLVDLLAYWGIDALPPRQDEHGIYLPTRRAA